MFLRKKRNDDADNVVELSSRLQVSETREQAYHTVIQTLLVLMKDFALDIAEIRADRYHAAIDRFGQTMAERDVPKRILSRFDKQKITIADFIDSQKHYIDEREAELRNIIDLLTRAMVSVDVENDAYHRKILEQGEKMEQITRLDDIRKIKAALEREVQTLRQTVRHKQDGEKARIESLAGQVKILRQELEEAKAESQRDGLTGTYNRKAFDDQLQSLVERDLIQRQDFALLVLDIDDFKKVNDTYGHPVGDRVILAMANTCNQMIRSDDFLARYGGEEFVILLPGASRRNAAKKAKQICAAVNSTRYTLDQGDDDSTLALTVSIGVTVFKRGDTAATVLERADQALYRAKRAGKNTAVTA